MQDVQRQGVQELIDQDAQVVEVLPREEFEEDHLPDAVHMTLRTIEAGGTAQLDRNVPVVVYCWDSA